MILEYTPGKDARVSEVLTSLDWSAFFYPSFNDNVPNLYGIGAVIHENDREKIAKSGIFDILDFVSPSIFLFKTNFFYLFMPVVVHTLEPFLIKKGSLLFSGQEEKKIDGWNVLKKRKNEIFLEISPIDKYTNRFNPLKHLVLIDEKLSKDEKACLLRVIDLGYPYETLSNIRIQSEPPLISLRIVAKHLFENNISVFSRINDVLVKNSPTSWNKIPSTNSILLFFEKLSLKPFNFLQDSRPEIYLESLLVDCIIPFKNANDLGDFTENLQEFKEIFKLSEFRIIVSGLEKEASPMISEKKLLEYRRYRIKMNSHFTHECLLPIHFVPDYLEELENFVIGDTLRMIDESSYEFIKERRKKKEFWIKGARIVLVLPHKFISLARKAVIDHFLDVLSLSFGSQAIAVRGSKNGLTELIFDIHFPRHRDYFVSGRHFGLFFDEIDGFDKWTASGAERAMMRDFENAEKFLENAEIALKADLDIHNYNGGWETKITESDLRRATENYRKLGIECPEYPSEPMYMKGSSKEEIEKAVRENKKWRISLSRYLNGISMKRQILEENISGRLRWRMMKTADSLIMESGFLPVRDNIVFENDLSTFYAELLSAIQENHGDYTSRWLGFVY